MNLFTESRFRHEADNLAERVGFEPTKPFWGLPVFETGLINHSSTSPFAWKTHANRFRPAS
jgi:hypothetical protein